MDAKTIILGAGPTGCTAATLLARAGHDVLLVDRNPVPTVAVGESLIPQAGDVLAELGVDMSGFLVKRGAVFTRGDELTRFDFAEALRGRHPYAWQCPRAEIDARLRAVALAAGARFTTARVREVELPGRVHTDQGTLRAEMVVDAGGRGQLLARQLGIQTSYPELRNAVRTAWYRGVERLAGEEEGDIVVATLGGAAWFWVIPFADGHTSVGLVGTKDVVAGEDAFDRAFAKCSAARDRLRHAERVEPWRGTHDFTTSSTAFHGPGWALAGDAATFLDPVFSTGLTLGLHGGRWLAQGLLEGDLVTYERRVRDAIDAFLPAVLGFYDGSFLSVCFSREARVPGTVRSSVISLLAGDVFDPGFSAARRIARRLPDLARRIEAGAPAEA